MLIEIDSNGRVIGCYEIGVSPDIPAGAFAITPAEDALIRNADQFADYIYSNGQLTYSKLPVPLFTMQATAWGNIKAKRSQIKHGGLLVGGTWFHTDEESRSQYATMYAAIAVNALPDAYSFDANWKTIDGSMTAMTVALLKSIINAGMASESLNYANAETHRLAMLASTDPSTYDFSTGWTATYP